MAQGVKNAENGPKMCENTRKYKKSHLPGLPITFWHIETPEIMSKLVYTAETWSSKGFSTIYFKIMGLRGVKNAQKWPKMCENTRKYVISHLPRLVAHWNL